MGTRYNCDRCGLVIVDPEWYTTLKQEGDCEEWQMLCEACKEEFETWMDLG